MTSGQKIAFSFLSAIILFTAFVFTTQARLFSHLETNFYAQKKVYESVQKLDKISEGFNSYITNVLKKLQENDDSYLKNGAVRSYASQNPSEKDVAERRRLTESLFAELPALEGIRLIDKNGRSLHFSTFDNTDVLKVSGINKIYKNYKDIQNDAGEIPFEKLASAEKNKILLDSDRSRLVISLPFCWVEGLYFGNIVFYFNQTSIEQSFTQKDGLSPGQTVYMISEPETLAGGFVISIPQVYKQDFSEAVLRNWKNLPAANSDYTTLSPVKIGQASDGTSLVMLSASESKYFKVSQLFTGNNFELSDEIKFTAMCCIFISLFLLFFLVLSFRKEPLESLKKRVKRIQYNLVKEYFDNKESIDWSLIVNQFKNRKKEMRSEIFKSLHVYSKKRRQELDEFLEKNWNEIFDVLGAKENQSEKTSERGSGGATLEEIRRVMEEVLQTAHINVNATQVVQAPVSVSSVAPVEPVEEIEEIEEIADAETVDEVEEIADAEPVEEIEEIDDAEPVEDAESIEEVEEIADAEPVEEISEVEEIEEAEEVADAEPVEEIEEIEELVDAEPVESIEEVADAETVKEQPAAENVDVTEEFSDDIEDLEGLVELEEIPDGEVLLSEFVDNPEEYGGGIIEKSGKIDPLTALFAAKQNEIKYKESNETFFESENFATVENCFAELIGIGPEYTYKKNKADSYPEFKVYSLSEDIFETSENESEIAENISEIIEELPAELPEPDVKPYFAMTQFASDISELEELKPEESKTEDNSVINEDNGVFSIAENLKCSGVDVDQNFKNLVDSVLN